MLVSLLLAYQVAFDRFSFLVKMDSSSACNFETTCTGIFWLPIIISLIVDEVVFPFYLKVHFVSRETKTLPETYCTRYCTRVPPVCLESDPLRYLRPGRSLWSDSWPSWSKVIKRPLGIRDLFCGLLRSLACLLLVPEPVWINFFKCLRVWHSLLYINGIRFKPSPSPSPSNSFYHH